MKQSPVLIIGADPAGLAMAGRLSYLNIPFNIIEKAENIAPMWRQHYDRLHLHTVKQFSHLPHQSFPEDYPTYVPRQKLVDYYESYVKKYNIQPYFGEEAVDVRKVNGEWHTKTKSGKHWVSDFVVVASGTNRVMHRPKWEGEESYKGEILHSRFYKNGKPFKGKKVLVIGMGNTGAEIALDLHEYGAKPCISIRGKINIVARDVNGRPVQVTAKKLEKLPEWLKEWLAVVIAKFTIGDLSKYGIERPKISPTKQLLLHGKTPVIDIGTVAEIKKGNIKILHDIERFYENGVIFKDGQQEEFDAIILATGYRAKVEEFVEGAEQLLDQRRVPSKAVFGGDYEGLYFLGFDNYKLGGILGTIYNDSEVIAEDIRAKYKVAV